MARTSGKADVVDFVGRYLQAEAALLIATLGEGARLSLGPGHLFAVASTEGSEWIALIGSSHDGAGVSLSAALLLRDGRDGLGVVGFAPVDLSAHRVVLEPGTGEWIDLKRARDVEMLRAPVWPAHAEFVRGWGAHGRDHGRGRGFGSGIRSVGPESPTIIQSIVDV
jgi:hypothetical protein